MTVEHVLVDALPSQPLVGGNWFARLHVAAAQLFGRTGLALVRRENARQVSLLGLISAAGALECAPPERLHLVGGGAAELALDASHRPRPQRYAGGDYYDLSSIDRGGAVPLCAIGIADVAGHGPAAVVETAMIDTILRTYRDVARFVAPTGTAAVADYLNRHMFTRRTRPSFATAFLSVWDGAARELRFTCAGHPPPLVRRAQGGAVETLFTGSDIPIQVLRDYRYSERAITLAPGDLLLLYTDGITEAVSRSGEQFGLPRLAASLAAAPGRPDAVIAAVTAAVARHADGQPYADDQTLLALCFT